MIDGPVRWPWQTPSQRDHVELAVASILTRISVGLIILGFVYELFCRLSRTAERDTLRAIARSVSMCLIIAWVCIIALAAFSMGYAATDAVITGLLIAGVFAGVIVGIRGIAVADLRPVATEKTTTTPAETMPEIKLEASSPTGLSLFTLGILTGVLIGLVGARIAANFRGPTIGFSVLGTPLFARDQTPINFWTGVGVIAAGWLLAGLVARRATYRVFSASLVLSTSAMGILFFCH